MSHNNSAFPLMISVVVMDAAQLAAVYALLGGASASAIAVGTTTGNAQRSSTTEQRGALPEAINTVAAPTPAAEQPAPVGAEASPPATDDSGEVDAHGWPWSADMHAATKGKTKDGLWRMKVGVTRPDPKPGFPVAESAPSTGTSSATDTSSATSPTATAPEPAPSGTTSAPAPAAEEEDEFAAFREAAATSDANDTAVAASVPARTFTDADLGALCNQAAVKLGDPSPIKEIIAKYVPEGQVAHSRNIPAEQRDAFAKEVEAKAGIEFAG